jgi:hypothetical protein
MDAGAVQQRLRYWRRQRRPAPSCFETDVATHRWDLAIFNMVSASWLWHQARSICRSSPITFAGIVEHSTLKWMMCSNPSIDVDRVGAEKRMAEAATCL